MATRVYKLSANFPSEEKFGLTSQVRRCAVSIPSNIAEGAGRGTDKDFLYFLSISMGSAFELETQLLIAEKLQLISQENLEPILGDLDQLQKDDPRVHE